MTIQEQITHAVRDSLRDILTARITGLIEDEVNAQLEDICIEEYIDVDELVSEALDNEGI